MIRRVCAVAVALVLLSGGGEARAQTGGGARKAARPAAQATANAGLETLLRQLADAQKWAGEQLWHTKATVDALPEKLAELQDGHAGLQGDVGKLREEVKGLYVELSSLRQQLEAVRGDVRGVDSNVSAFRTFSGFFIAAMILLLAVVAVMTIRR